MMMMMKKKNENRNQIKTLKREIRFKCAYTNRVNETALCALSNTYIHHHQHDDDDDDNDYNDGIKRK